MEFRVNPNIRFLCDVMEVDAEMARRDSYVTSACFRRLSVGSGTTPRRLSGPLPHRLSGVISKVLPPDGT